jgi:hypothetical protein
MENQGHWLDHEPEEVVREALGNLESELLIIEVTMELNDLAWDARVRQLRAQAVPLMREWIGWHELRGLIEHDTSLLELELDVLEDIYYHELAAFETTRDQQRLDYTAKEREIEEVRGVARRRGIAHA